MLYLTTFILRWYNCLGNERHFVPKVWHQMMMQDHIPTQCYDVLTQNVTSSLPLCPACDVDHAQWASGDVEGSI